MPNDGLYVAIIWSVSRKCNTNHSSLVLIKGLKERGAQPFGEQLSALGIQVSAVNKRGFGQFGVLKRQEDENAFLGGGLLDFF